MNSFITISNGHSGRFVDYINPGIKDFIISYISDYQSIQERLLEHSYYIDQLFSIFQDGSHPFIDVCVSEKLSSLVLDTFERLWEDFRSCKIMRIRSEKHGTYCSSYPIRKIVAVDKFLSSYEFFVKTRPGFIEQKLSQNILCNQSVFHGLVVIEHIDLSKLSCNKDEIFSFFRNHISELYEYERFVTLLDTKFIEYKDCKDEQTFLDDFNRDFLKEVEEDDADCESLKSYMEDFQKLLPYWDSTEVSESIDEKQRKENENDDSMIDDYDFYRENGEMDDNSQIDNLFSSFQF